MIIWLVVVVVVAVAVVVVVAAVVAAAVVSCKLKPQSFMRCHHTPCLIDARTAVRLLKAFQGGTPIHACRQAYMSTSFDPFGALMTNMYGTNNINTYDVSYASLSGVHAHSHHQCHCSATRSTPSASSPPHISQLGLQPTGVHATITLANSANNSADCTSKNGKHSDSYKLFVWKSLVQEYDIQCTSGLSMVTKTMINCRITLEKCRRRDSKEIVNLWNVIFATKKENAHNA